MTAEGSPRSRGRARARAGAVRFVATADLQLGMRRRYLDPDAQARFADARIQSIRTVGRLAAEHGAAFVVVAGDVFESNQVDRRTVWRAIDALADVPVPVLLLPGNHDPLTGGAVLASPTFTGRCPDHVEVITTTAPIEVAPGVDVVGAPWTTKRPLTDLAGAAVDDLAPADGRVRILVAHGAVDQLHPGRAEDPAAIRLDRVEAALADGRIHAAVIGDRHSTTAVGTTGRVWYPGAPEPTDPSEADPGNALLFDLTDGRCHVETHAVGTWRFLDVDADLADDGDVDALATRLSALPDRDRTVLFLRWRGAVTVRGRAALDDLVADAREVFGGVEVREQHCDLLVTAGDDGPSLFGFGQWTVDALRERIDDGDPAAVDALALLHRLAEGAA